MSTICPESRQSRHLSSLSFLLRKSAVVYNRRRSKITSILCSFFTASYVMNWPTYFPDNPLRYVPSFDARIVLYPGIREVRDYFSWRQSDSVSHLFPRADDDF
jgi:tRNA(His) guanylyltransferase